MMTFVAQEWLLVGSVAAVGVLHTIVPDHWIPITLVARRERWTMREVARAAFLAGTGHTVSTLLIGLVVWVAGVAFATRVGNLVSLVSGIALIGFGAWIAIASLLEMRGDRGHAHEHHDDHDHFPHDRSRRTTLLLILGSSPMIEGIPAFFAAGRYGPGLIAVMAAVFAVSTIATYVTLCVTSVAGLHAATLGPFERYGEAISGAFIVIVGLAFLFR